MTLNWNEVPEGLGASKPFSTEVDLSTQDRDEQVLFPSLFQIEGEIVRGTDCFSLSYRARGHFLAVCCRCLEPIEENWEREFSHCLEDSPNEQFDSFAVFCPGGEVNLSDLVLADFFLELPSRFLCKLDCKGLCLICGKNQNKEPCACKEHEMDSRLFQLKKFLE